MNSPGMQEEAEATEKRVLIVEKQLLRRHIRDAHRNLLGEGPQGWMSSTPLPKEDLDSVPFMWLHAIHEANHAGLYREHPDDHWGVPNNWTSPVGAS